MGLFNNLFSSAGSSLVDSIGEALDGLFTNKEEKKKAKLAIKQAVQNHEKAMASEITKRHKYDMQSDSWLSKNIRPSVLVYSLLAITIFALTDGNIGGFEVKSAYIELLGNLLISASIFYFGARTYDKHTNYKLIKELKNQKSNDGVEDLKFEKVSVPSISVSDEDSISVSDEDSISVSDEDS